MREKEWVGEGEWCARMQFRMPVSMYSTSYSSSDRGLTDSTYLIFMIAGTFQLSSPLFSHLNQHSPSHVQKKENKFSEPRARFYLGEIVLALADSASSSGQLE